MSTLKQSFTGTNVYVSIVLFLGGLFVGFPQDLATNTVEYLVTGVTGVFLIREKMKSATIDWKAWLNNKNTWTYLSAIVLTWLPQIPGDLFTQLSNLAQAAIGGNWQGIAMALFAIGNILYHLFKKPDPDPSPAV